MQLPSFAGSRCSSLIDEVYANIRGVNLYNILDSCHVPAPHQATPAGLRASHTAVFTRRLGHTPKCLASRCASRVLPRSSIWTQLVAQTKTCRRLVCLLHGSPTCILR